MASGGGRGGAGGGTMLLKSVSLFLARGRRASQSAAAAAASSAAAAAGLAGGGGGGAGRGGGKRRRKGGGGGQRQSPPAAGGAGAAAGPAGRRAAPMGDDAAATAGGKGAPLLIEQLRRRTHFTRQEIEALCRVYRSLVASTSAAGGGPAAAQAPAATAAPIAGAPAVEGLDRVVFRELLHNTFDLVTEEVLMDRVFCAFDRCNDGVVRLEEWVHGLSVFLRGSREQRTAFCFLVYDLNSDGYITRDEMFHLLRNCLVKHPNDEDPDEGVKDLVELALRKLDADRDGKVSFQDFQRAVLAEPLLLEAFGQCLPADQACHTFLATLKEPQAQN